MFNNDLIGLILEHSDKGLDLICHYFPQAREVAGKKKKFRIRGTGDKNPSACLTLRKGQDGIEKWLLTDFGDSFYSTGKDGVDVFQHEEGIADKKEAVRRLCELYNITNVESVQMTKERTEWLPILENQKEGNFRFVEKPFTQRELTFLAPNGLTAEMCKELGYASAEYVERVVMTKNGLMRVQIYSDEWHPIFVRKSMYEGKDGQEGCFYKTYRPKAVDAQYKFSYAGLKPTDYICGEAELKRAYEQNGEKQLECAIIVSGERDALCVKAWGFHPIWFNSETSGRNPMAVKRLYKYVKILFYVPDIDKTGLVAGRSFEMKILSLYTVDLPMDLLKKIGDQGKPMKDLRDWVGLHRSKNEFQNILNGACPLEFWTEKKGKVQPVLRPLKRMLCVVGGFYQIVGTVDTPKRLVQVDEHRVVKEVTVDQIKTWLTEVCPDQLNLPFLVREMLNNPKVITNGVLENLVPFEGDFGTTGPDFQIHAFANSAYRVTKDGITLLTEDERPHIWEKQVADFNFTQLNPFFTYQLELDEHGHLHGKVKLLNTDCNALRVVVNSSRTAWKEEVDYAHATSEQLRQWRSMPPRLDAPNLTTQQQAMQMDCFFNKIYGIGELMHSYRSPSRARAVMAIDYTVGDTKDQANGRGGKSVIYESLLKLAGKSVETIHSSNVTESSFRFMFGRVTEATDIVLLEDCGSSMKYSWLYPYITQGMRVERKGVQAHTLAFEESPKIAITTNGVPSDDDPSTRDRIIPTSFCDYYHADGEGYRERWSVKDDCGMDIGVPNYSVEHRNRDVNFLLQCEQFYLHCVSLTDTPFKAPEGNLKKRVAQQVCGDNMTMYLDEYFNNTDHFNRDISYAEFYNYFNDNMPQKHLPTQAQVVKSVKAYCKAHDIVAFPAKLVTDKKRGTIRRNNIQYFHFIRVQPENEN